jgi:hypothetical protein
MALSWSASLILLEVTSELLRRLEIFVLGALVTTGTGVRDAQLGEEAHRYANRTGALVYAFLLTLVMNLLRRGG